ncbi:MAG: Xaa-Pro aminopeptidase [Gammaproteobacteria bacterium]|nr:Xaa-Pro aminopeptidase [Gammaproteobacteria bacterium]
MYTHKDLREYARRRRALIKQLPPKSVLIIATGHEKIRNRDAEYRFRPASDFYYLCGFAEADAVLVIRKDKTPHTVLFSLPKNTLAETWTGRRVGQTEARSVYGVDEAYSLDDMNLQMPTLLENQQRIYYPMGEEPDFDQQVQAWIKKVKQKYRSGVNAPTEIHSHENLLHNMRLIKSPWEIQRMRVAAKVSAQAHQEAMRSCKPGQWEYQIEAGFDHVFRKNNCHHAYNSIVASGDNANILHYTENNSQLQAKDLLLIDAGAEFDNYAADITRTFPVSGKFSNEQKLLYQLVLDAQQAAINQIKPGKPWNLPHDAAVKVLTKGLVKLGILKGNIRKLIKEEKYKQFYMHNTGHWLGMDVHDVGAYKVNGQWRKFLPGMVLTVEPGIYIAANTKGVAKKWCGIGIRIEDDVLVNKSSCEILTSDVVKEISDIEALMAEAI